MSQSPEADLLTNSDSPEGSKDSESTRCTSYTAVYIARMDEHTAWSRYTSTSPDRCLLRVDAWEEVWWSSQQLAAGQRPSVCAIRQHCSTRSMHSNALSNKSILPVDPPCLSKDCVMRTTGGLRRRKTGTCSHKRWNSQMSQSDYNKLLSDNKVIVKCRNHSYLRYNKWFACGANSDLMGTQC